MSSTRTCWPKRSTYSTSSPSGPADGGAEAIKRSALSRANARVHLDQCWRRLRSYVAATVPDIDMILTASRTRTLAVLGRWPDLRALARARRATVAGVLREHSHCGGRQDQIADQLRSAACDWVRILDGYYGLAFWQIKVSAMLEDIEDETRCFDRYSAQLEQLRLTRSPADRCHALRNRKSPETP